MNFWKFRFFYFSFLTTVFFMYSCGTGGNADEGVSVLVEIDSITPTYLEIDLIRKYDDNDDGICDRYTIPTNDAIQITFKSIIPEGANIQPSDVSITSYKVKYIPKTRTDIPIYEETFPVSCLIAAGETKTCSFPIFYKNNKLEFYNNGWFDDFDVEITVYGKEIIYDKSISLTGNTTARISDIIQDGEPTCQF